jgi:hypothetical protein
MRRTVAFERIASEPEVLDRDMTPADIAAALQRLRFGYRRQLMHAHGAKRRSRQLRPCLIS